VGVLTPTEKIKMSPAYRGRGHLNLVIIKI